MGIELTEEVQPLWLLWVSGLAPKKFRLGSSYTNKILVDLVTCN